jgi:hypothetical protein
MTTTDIVTLALGGLFVLVVAVAVAEIIIRRKEGER